MTDAGFQSSTRKIEAVAFDLDGLMFNTEDVYWKVGSELMRRRGREYTQELSNAIMGRPPQVCFEKMIEWHSLDDTWEAMAAESEKVFVSMLDDGVDAMPGMLDLLNALERAAIPKAICTSSSPEVVEAVLSRFGMRPRFEFVLTAADITRGKPHPQIYQKAAQRFGIDPHHLLVLEDSQTGCTAAAASGAFTVAVPAGLSRQHDFSMADLVADSLEDPRIRQVLGLG
ncbi:MAG: HAD family phosphatase [Planctomycetaceae bacterium]|nr:HAD family phosphatase [Planctomycetaceae bacterium]